MIKYSNLTRIRINIVGLDYLIIAQCDRTDTPLLLTLVRLDNVASSKEGWAASTPSRLS